MKTDSNLVRRSFPQVASPSSNEWKDGLFTRIWERFVQYLLGNAEPHIVLKRDRSGEHYWLVYDPTTSRSFTFWTANEVRIWLEDRYSH